MTRGIVGSPPKHFDDVYIGLDLYRSTHRGDMEIETGFQAIRAGKYNTSC